MGKERITKVTILLVVAAIVAVGVYLRLSRGTEPDLADLPEGVIAKTATFQVTQSELDSYFAGLNSEQREIESKDLEGALVKFIERKLLLEKAKSLPKEALPDTNGKNQTEAEDALIEALKTHVTKDVKVPEEAIRKYYDEHRSEYEGQPGGSYEEMHDAIRDYLRYNLVYKEFEKFVESLVAKAEIKRDRKWIHKVRANVTDPLTKVRASGKVVVADFGRGVCPSCVDMEAVLEELRKEVGGKYEIVVVNIDKFPAAARQYGIKSIPQQIYFNTDGEEVYRPDPGFTPKEKVLGILQTIDKKGTYEGEPTFTYKVKHLIAIGSWLAIILVFVLGLLTASNPCVLATVPLLIGFIGGQKEASGWKRSFIFSLFFVLGLSTMFMTLGIIAGLTGSLLGQVGDFWTYLVVGVCVVMGLHLLGVLEFNIPTPQGLKPGQRGIISSFMFGLLFGIISTPCAVPIVAVLMVLIAKEGSIFYAAVMLLVYSLGHSALLLVAGTSMGAAKKIIESRGLTTATNVLRKIAAALIIAVAFWFLFR